MTTRPLRHADDRDAELGNLRAWRERMAADLEWVESLIVHVEGGGESDVIRGVHHSPSPSCRSIVEEGRQMDPPDRS